MLIITSVPGPRWWGTLSLYFLLIYTSINSLVSFSHIQYIVSANVVLLRMVTAAVSPHFFPPSIISYIYFFGTLHLSLFLSHFFKDRIVEDGSHIEFNACSLYYQSLIGFQSHVQDQG